jgi:acyl-CoA reductase-like NAD-dependent aldehyde dehydrogenase
MRTLGLFLTGSWVDGEGSITVRTPLDGTPVARVARAGEHTLRSALDGATAARGAMASLPLHARAAILEAAAAQVVKRRDEFARLVVEEAGKPVQLARIEADRCAETMLEAARVARSMHGEMLDLSAFPSGASSTGLLRRFPVGVVVGITPFNFPLNLVAHKLAPAVAAGCPIILKPASQTPSPALKLAEILHRAGLPPGGVSVVPCAGSEVGVLLNDPRVAMLSFTGSADVGWQLKQQLWDRKVALELGGNAAVIVEPDAGNLTAVARRIALGAFAYAGQSCISVQRVLVHAAVAADLKTALIEAAQNFPTGDPTLPETLCGPMVSPVDADRIESWVRAAERRGAKCLLPWRRDGSVVRPNLLEAVPMDDPVWSREVFAPVAAISSYTVFEQALTMVNDSVFGLQAGLFTRDVEKIQRAFETLEVGGLIQGDVPSWRTDPMPYGGVKRSGIGREGPRYAVEEMTEPRLLVLR